MPECLYVSSKIDHTSLLKANVLLENLSVGFTTVLRSEVVKHQQTLKCDISDLLAERPFIQVLPWKYKQETTGD